MPRRDGTGPEGKGPKTGRGVGFCGGENRRRGKGDFRNGRAKDDLAQNEKIENEDKDRIDGKREARN